MAHSYRHGDEPADDWQPDKGDYPPDVLGQELFHEEMSQTQGINDVRKSYFKLVTNQSVCRNIYSAT